MYTIPQFLYDKRIYNYLTDLIDCGVEDYSQITESNKEDLIVRIIDVLGVDAYSLIIDSEDFDKTLKHFSDYLKTGKLDCLHDLGEQMRLNAIKHYDYHLEQLFNQILTWSESA